MDGVATLVRCTSCVIVAASRFVGPMSVAISRSGSVISTHRRDSAAPAMSYNSPAAGPSPWCHPAAGSPGRIAGKGFALSPALSVVACMSATTSPSLFGNITGVLVNTAHGVAMKLSVCMWGVTQIASGPSTDP